MTPALPLVLVTGASGHVGANMKSGTRHGRPPINARQSSFTVRLPGATELPNPCEFLNRARALIGARVCLGHLAHIDIAV